MLFYSINTGVRTISPKENCPLGFRVRVRVRVRIRVGGGQGGGNFPRVF